MVSHLAYYSFKEVNAKGRISFTYAFVIPLCFVLIALNPPTVLFAMATTYALSGPVTHLWRRKRKREREEDRRSEAS